METNKKQTAVNWIENQIDYIIETYDNNSVRYYLEKVFKQAKEIEKEQIIDFSNDLLAQNDVNYTASPNLAEKYYKETYENE